MNEPHPRVRKAAQVLKPLAACLALALAAGQPAGASPTTAPASTIAAITRPAATLTVTSCADDADPGTLRNTAANAVSGDLIDLGALTCSTITLTQGAIVTDVDDLTLRGPEGGLAIDGGGTDSILVHYGAGPCRSSS